MERSRAFCREGEQYAGVSIIHGRGWVFTPVLKRAPLGSPLVPLPPGQYG